MPNSTAPNSVVADLDEPHEDPGHGGDIDALVAVEDEDLPAEEASQGLHGLSLPGARGPVGVPAQPQLHALGVVRSGVRGGVVGRI